MHRSWNLCIVAFCGLSAYVQAQEATACQLSEVAVTGPLSQLSDLRTPTPWTYTDTIGYLDCVVTSLTATPNFYLEDSFYTAVISGVSYSAQNEFVWPDGVNVTTTDTTYVYLTFPQLTVTNLHPGDRITMEWTQIGGASGDNILLVPLDATTVSTTSRTPSPSLTTTTASSTTASSTTASSTTSQSSSSIAAPVAGGVVGGVAVLGVLVAILVFCLRKSPRATATDYPPMAEENPQHSRGAGLSYRDAGDDEQGGYRGKLGKDEKGPTVSGRLRYDGVLNDEGIIQTGD